MAGTRVLGLSAVMVVSLIAASGDDISAAGGTIITPAQCNNVDCRIFHPLPDDSPTEPANHFACVANENQTIRQCQYIPGQTPSGSSCFTPFNPTTPGWCINRVYEATFTPFNNMWIWQNTGEDCTKDNYAQCSQ